MSTPLVEHGYISSAHHLRGEVFVKIFGDPELIKKHGELLLIRETEKKRLNVKSLRPHKEGFIVALDGVNDRIEAEKLIGFKLMLKESDLVAAPGEKPYLNEVLGFSVFESKQMDQSLGEIVKFSSNGAQILAIVKSAEHEFIFPFVEGVIHAIDYEKRRVLLNQIEGLMDIKP
jgi:16S rRNA processing protein RimM